MTRLDASVLRRARPLVVAVGLAAGSLAVCALSPLAAGAATPNSSSAHARAARHHHRLTHHRTVHHSTTCNHDGDGDRVEPRGNDHDGCNV